MSTAAYEALRELVTAHDTLQARSWPGGPAEYEQQRDRMRAAWITARAALAAPGAAPEDLLTELKECHRWLVTIHKHFQPGKEIHDFGVSGPRP